MKSLNNIKILLVVLVISFAATPLSAQFTITGEIRPRAEFRNGFKSLTTDNTDAAFFIEQRSRLYLGYTETKYSFQLTLQDVRLWGENSQIFKNDNSLFNVFEAWGAYHFNDKFKLKVGRQALDYDNARILGNLAWAQQARSHDLLKFEYKSNDFSLHFGAAFNQEDVLSRPEPARLASTFYNGINNYKTIQYLWLNKKYEKGNTSFLFLNNGIQAPDSVVNFSQTAGIYSKDDFGTVDLSAELYYQFGKTGNGADLSGLMAALFINFDLGKTNLGIGGDYLTGTDPGSAESSSFTPLYGTNHKFYGLMDYFYVGNPSGDVGLIDVYLNAKFGLSDKSALNIALHRFNSQVDLTEQFAAESNTLGTEIDLVYNLNIDKAVNLKIGYSQMFADSNMELIKTGDSNATNNWAWAMLTIKPKLFESKKNDN